MFTTEHYKPLSKNQQLLWIGQELNPDSPIYNMVMRYEIKGAFSFSHFKAAFNKLVETNDVFRSVFILQDESPIQKYLNKVAYKIIYKDFSNENSPKETYKIWENRQSQKLFDIEKCLFECAIIKLDEEDYIWYLNQHHLITDGWSNAIIYSRISELYHFSLQNNLDQVVNFPSYQEFYENEQKLIASATRERTVKYWEEKSNQLPTISKLFYKEGIHLNTSSNRLSIRLGKDRMDKIHELANQKGIKWWNKDITLYNIFLTTLFSYLNKITGQERLTIGSPAHNRTTNNFKETIGFFVETFPLLVEFEAKETFTSLIKKIQIESNSFLLNAQQGISNSKLSRSYNVLFNYINSTTTKFQDFSVKSNWVHPGHNDPRHQIRLHVHDLDNTGDIQLYFDLNTATFSENEQERIPQQFLNILDAFLEDKDQKIEEVNFVTKAEITQIEQWNTTGVMFPKKETLLTKFKKQVVKTPNATALVFKGENLTYKELDQKSNQVAHFLKTQGIHKGDCIIVSLERSFEMMIYIYGIIKSGAVYLPLDTHTPLERLRFIIQDASAVALFYNHKHLDFSKIEQASCFNVNALSQKIGHLNQEAPTIPIVPEDTAYIIYTSGSTGTPKGVICHHEGICNRLNWMNLDFPITASDTFLQKTPITFDVSLFEIFWPLQMGAKLVIEEAEGHKNPYTLIKTIVRYGVTIVHFVPSMLNVFMEANQVEKCKNTIQRIFCSGEALSVSIVNKAHVLLNAEIYNLYGPTEASVEVSYWHCKRGEQLRTIPIGFPVANTQLYILDEQLQMLPIGIIGELYIAGKQVASGYLNRDELTKERFLKDPFSANPKARMYKTGDLVRYREDGSIEYHGRTDNQVKIRGVRIELGEIEKSIEKHLAISQAIVVVDKLENLIAYYTGKEQDEKEIIGFLKAILPAHLIPLKIQYLEAFEYLSSGKINRKKLPLFNENCKEEITTNIIAPKNEIEEEILNVWKDILKLERIGVNENFIRLGGNSLNAISITSRLKTLLELDLSIADVFNYPTIRAYAKYVEDMIIKLMQESELES